MEASNLSAPKSAVFLSGTNKVSTVEFAQQVDACQSVIASFAQQANKAKLRVLLFNQDILIFSAWLFALGRAGHTIVLPPNGQTETLSELASHCDVTAGVPVTGLPQLFEPSLPFTSLPTPIVWPTQGILEFWTSGSTGDAKAVVKEWRNINNELAVLAARFERCAGTHVIASVSHQHIYGLLFGLLLPLKLGSCVCGMFSYPEHMKDLIDSVGPSVLVASPAFLSRLVQDNVLSASRDQIVAIFSSGGMLADQVAIALCKDFGKGVDQIYGSTETGGIAVRQVTKLPASSWSVLENVSIKLASESKNIIVNSPFFQEDEIRLEDKGELLDSKHFTLLGRSDRTIKLEEKRINLTQLERFCQSQEWVEQCRVVVLRSHRHYLGAVIMLNDKGWEAFHCLGKRAVNSRLKAHLSGKYEAVCIPRKWRYLTALPYNNQGKLPLRDLEALFE